MIGKIPEHIGSKLGTPLSVDDSAQEEVLSAMPEQEQSPQEISNEVSQDLPARKIRKKKTIKRKRSTQLTTNETNVIQETAPAEGPKALEEPPHTAPMMANESGKTETKSDVLKQLKVQEELSKQERLNYLDNLSNETKDFLKKVRDERREWLQNFKSSC